MKPATDIAEFSQGLASSAVAPVERTSAPSRLRDFYELTKPRMNFLVVCTTAVGYSMAPHQGHWGMLVHAVLGTAMTAASASVLNQHAEREYDGLMPRTRNRPLPGGRVSPREALLWGMALG